MRYKSRLFLLLVFVTALAFVLSCAEKGPAPSAPVVTQVPEIPVPVVHPVQIQGAPVPEAPGPVQPADPEKSELATNPVLTTKGPPHKPANHAGRTSCLVCHKDGVAKAPKIPANHAGRTDAVCSGCHK